MSFIDRRQFAAGILASLGTNKAMASTNRPLVKVSPQQFHLKPNGWMPNSPLSVLFYRNVLPKSADLAGDMERIFAANGWPPQLRNGIYPFHHYHSTAHEVPGFAAGRADLVLGGEGGEHVTVHTAIFW
jgi:uncharacterized protein YjlB